MPPFVNVIEMPQKNACQGYCGKQGVIKLQQACVWGMYGDEWLARVPLRKVTLGETGMLRGLGDKRASRINQWLVRRPEDGKAP